MVPIQLTHHSKELKILQFLLLQFALPAVLTACLKLPEEHFQTYPSPVYSQLGSILKLQKLLRLQVEFSEAECEEASSLELEKDEELSPTLSLGTSSGMSKTQLPKLPR